MKHGREEAWEKQEQPMQVQRGQVGCQDKVGTGDRKAEHKRRSDGWENLSGNRECSVRKGRCTGK